MADPVGGREAEIETVARAIDPLVFRKPGNGIGRARARKAAAEAIAALDALRSSGSAAQTWKVKRCPTCAELGSNTFVQGCSHHWETTTLIEIVPSGSAAQNQEECDERIEMLIRERDHAWAIVESLQRSGSAAQNQEGCPDCHKTPETCWLPPHLCSHPNRSPQDENP